MYETMLANILTTFLHNIYYEYVSIRYKIHLQYTRDRLKRCYNNISKLLNKYKPASQADQSKYTPTTRTNSEKSSPLSKFHSPSKIDPLGLQYNRH